MTATPHLALPLIAAGQAQKHVTHNEALYALDALLHCAVKDKDLASPPASPLEGDRYIVAASPTGAWAGKAGHIAAWQDGLWRFHAPKAGWLAFVVDEPQLYYFDGSVWEPGVGAITNLQNLALLGIGTTADATNPFSTRINNVLHAARTVAEGGNGDIKVKLSKESAAKTASCLFQTNFSGRAEFGLTGDDSFHVKTSADGASWVDALVLAAATGAATFAAGATFGGTVGAPASAAARAGLRLPHGAAPSAPVNGDLWSTTAGWFVRTNGATQQLVVAGSAPSFTSLTVTTAGITMQGTPSAANALVLPGGTKIYDGPSGTAMTAVGNAFFCYKADLSAELFRGETAHFIPGTDNDKTLGSASRRWSQLYAGTTTINTSSADEKTNFRAPDDAVLLAALDTELSFYQWTESVERKGARKARWHFGPTAQGFAAACRARGVDPATLAVYCEDPALAPAKRSRIGEAEGEAAETEHEILELTGETLYGLRLDQFDRLLQEARWRVVTGTLRHTPGSR